jgi:hypothetical protein
MKKQEPKFQPGDRVAERPKASYIPNLSSEVRERIAPYRTQRYGTVVNTFIKKGLGRTRKPAQLPYVNVIWDGKFSCTDHAQNRLILEKDLPQLLDVYVETIHG